MVSRNGTDPYEASRQAMVRQLRLEIQDERVLGAMTKVPRERFVPSGQRRNAYADRPLPIGQGQTISQPLMVALMLQELKLTGDEKVLDIGTGSGYQAALLGALAAEVVTVERVEELAERADQVLKELGYTNIQVHLVGEDLGWPAAAPYDAIVVGAAAPRVPPALVDQLRAGGRLVLPVGDRASQDLMVVEKRPEGVTVMRKGGCRFVPLIGPGGFSGSQTDDPNL